MTGTLRCGWSSKAGRWPIAPSSNDYVAAEAAAREAQAGAWRGTFLAPEAYRAQIAAIEARYAELAADSARAEAEADLAGGRLELGGLTAPGSAEPSGASFEEHELRFDAFTPGFIDTAIEPPEVFDWTSVAAVLEATRRKGVGAVGTSVVDAIWAELAERPSETVETRDGDDFHAALRSRSAGWMVEGRQPILFVMAPDLPNWVRKWFAGQPPAGAEITRRQERVGPGYLGTIDGVDVRLGPGRQRAALLVPSDVLAGVTFRKDADGRILALEVGARNEWVLRYGMALEWRSDPMVWLAFPQMASATPDAD